MPLLFPSHEILCSALGSARSVLVLIIISALTSCRFPLRLPSVLSWAAFPNWCSTDIFMNYRRSLKVSSSQTPSHFTHFLLAASRQKLPFPRFRCDPLPTLVAHSPWELCPPFLTSLVLLREGRPWLSCAPARLPAFGLCPSRTACPVHHCLGVLFQSRNLTVIISSSLRVPVYPFNTVASPDVYCGVWHSLRIHLLAHFSPELSSHFGHCPEPWPCWPVPQTHPGSRISLPQFNQAFVWNTFL